jgi:hypothetical protein
MGSSLPSNVKITGISQTDLFNLPAYRIWGAALTEAASQEEGSPANHWQLFIQTSPSQTKNASSVSVDPQITNEPAVSADPDSYDPQGFAVNFAIRPRNGYVYSQDSLHTVSVTVRKNTTVGNVLMSINTAGGFHYDFSSGGRGCRAWAATMFQFFDKQGLTNSSSQTQTAIEATNNLYEEDGTAVPYPPEAGTFHDGSGTPVDGPLADDETQASSSKQAVPLNNAAVSKAVVPSNNFADDDTTREDGLATDDTGETAEAGADPQEGEEADADDEGSQSYYNEDTGDDNAEQYDPEDAGEYGEAEGEEHEYFDEGGQDDE